MASPVRSNGKWMLGLQIQEDLHLGVEDHLASSLTMWESRSARTLTAPFALTTGLAVHGKLIVINQLLVGSQ